MLYTYPKVQKNGHTELYICWELGLDLLVRGSKKTVPPDRIPAKSPKNAMSFYICKKL